jgi:phenylacetic acid degradation operon negative regulatory protein
MKARWLVLHLFGEYLRPLGGEVRLRHLIALMDCFDVPESTVRVVAARLRREGWLVSHRDGRETSYALSDEGVHDVAIRRSRIFERITEPWDGQWHMVIYQVPETERALREQLRRRLCWLGFGPLTSSVWLSPHDRISDVRLGFADRPVVRIDTFRACTGDPETDRELAARSWELHALNREYTELVERYRARTTCGRAVSDARQALVERAELMHEFRAFPQRDPDLPAALLPGDWAGHVAQALFVEAYALLGEPAETCVTDLLGVRLP